MAFFSFVFVFMRYCSMFVVVELRGLLAWYFPLKLMAFYSVVFVFMRYCSVLVVVKLCGPVSWRKAPYAHGVYLACFLYLYVILVWDGRSSSSGS